MGTVSQGGSNPQEDFDEEGVELVVELEDSWAREGFIQCVETVPTSDDTKDLAVNEDKDADWSCGALAASPTANPQGAKEGGSQQVEPP